jgi:hypothetical protein
MVHAFPMFPTKGISWMRVQKLGTTGNPSGSKKANIDKNHKRNLISFGFLRPIVFFGALAGGLKTHGVKYFQG